MSFGQATKIAQKIVHNTKPIIFLILFAYTIAVIPDNLQVSHNFSQPDQVRAAYEQVLLESAKSTANDSIAFDTMIVDVDNGQSAISYTIAPGDSLAKIAQNFGITVDDLIAANDIPNPHALRPGMKLVIAYQEGIPYDVLEPQTAKEFAKRNNLNLNDFLTVNYFDDEGMMLEEGWQVILPLNEREARERNLLPREEFVMLDLNEQPEQEIIAYNNEDEKLEEPSEQLPGADSGYVQTIITAEDTEKRLQEMAEQEKNERKEQEEKEKQALLAQQEQKENIPPKEVPTIIEEPQEEIEVVDQPENPCGEGQCFFRNKCRSYPENAHCTPEDPENAWTCNEGFEEKGRSCTAIPLPAPRAIEQEKEQENIPEPAPVRQIAQLPTSTVQGEAATLSEWYTNYVAQEDYRYNGFGAGHCTEAVDYFWQKNHGIDIRQARRGGNANQWPDRARNAGFTVNSSPAVGAIANTNISGYRSRYGHVAYVTSVNREDSTITVIDQNYAGRHITTERIIPMSEVSSYIHPK